MTAPVPLVERLAGALIAEGAGAGSSIHSWRCEYPDRYGPCDCVTETARALLPVVEQAVAEGRAAALREAAEDLYAGMGPDFVADGDIVYGEWLGNRAGRIGGAE